MKSKIRILIISFLVITIFSCEKNKELETNNNMLSVDFSDGLDASEREVLNKAKDLVLESATITDGKYNLSNINPLELGIADRLFKYIQANSAYLNSKIDQGVFKISGKMLVPACDEESHLKARPKDMHMSAVTADDPNEPIGGGSSLVLERFENAKDWFKVYSENGYTVWEYTNTTYTYSTRYTWVNNPYVYNYGDNYYVYFDPSGSPIPSPKPNNILIKEKIKKKLCEIYNGIIDLSELKQDKNRFSLAQEQFIIGLANVAAMNGLNLPLNNLKSDLGIFSTNSELYSKYSVLDNHTRYTSSWSRVYNSSPNSDYALLSPKVANTNFQLKYYPEKNGEHSALGLVKEGIIDHSLEAAIELIEVLGKNAGLPDDFLYDMHLYNALNFMEDHCNE